MKVIIIIFQIGLMTLFFPAVQAQPVQNEKLHIIVIGAHPDDPDKVGGTAYKWAQLVMMC